MNFNTNEKYVKLKTTFNDDSLTEGNLETCTVTTLE